MKNADSAPFSIRQNDGKAIGRLHRYQQPRRIRNDSVSSQRLFRHPVALHSVNPMDQVRMNLPQRNQRPTSASIRNAQFLEENLAVALDGRARVVFREAKIQRIPAVGARYSAMPRREGMDQPSQFTQLFGMQELYLVFCDAFDHDSSMIPEQLMERRARSPVLAEGISALPRRASRTLTSSSPFLHQSES
jgi:hypothetical protein